MEEKEEPNPTARTSYFNQDTFPYFRTSLQYTNSCMEMKQLQKKVKECEKKCVDVTNCILELRDHISFVQGVEDNKLTEVLNTYNKMDKAYQEILQDVKEFMNAINTAVGELDTKQKTQEERISKIEALLDKKFPPALRE
jgi:chromosome segregation ATPase